MNHKSAYNCFELDGLKVLTGFKQWTFQATTYKHKGFKEEEYISFRIETYQQSLKKALKIATT